MANMTYLAGTNQKQIYPSMRSGFREAQQVIAAAKYSLPMMWLLVFGESDFEEAVVETDDDELELYAPIASKSKALAVLEKNGERVEARLEDAQFAGYRSLFRSEIEAMPFEYITIELNELDGMGPRGEVRARLRSLYAELESESPRSLASRLFARPPKLLRQLCYLSGYKPKLGLVKADSLASGKFLGRELENHSAMLGSTWKKPTAWDPSGGYETSKGSPAEDLPQQPPAQPVESAEVSLLVRELAQHVRSLDWEGQDGVCGDMPSEWDRFVANGDASWDFGNSLVHQETVQPAAFLLVPSLIALAKSQHANRHYALTILSSCLMLPRGAAADQSQLAKRGPVPNPFKPGEMMTLGSEPPPEALAREEEQMQTMRAHIEAEFDAWAQLATEGEGDLRMAALGVLAGFTGEHREPAEKIVRNALEQATDESERGELEWLCEHLDAANR